MQDRPACMGKTERDPLPRGRAVVSAIRRDPAPSPPSAHKRRNESLNDPAPKGAQTHGSGAAPDFMDLSPARDGPSQGSSITYQPEQHADENGFAHLLLERMSPDGLSDQSAKVNTWRNIPARCRPKIADIIIDIEQRATGGSECACDNCHNCNLRYQAWLEFHYLFQSLMRNKERLQPEKDPGPKVDAISRERVQRAKAHGWKGLVEEYLADAALRLKSDLDRGQPAPTARLL